MADLTIHELQNEATTPANDDYAVLDGATAGTRKITPANLATWVLGKISSLATTVTSFASGDFIAVSNPTDGTRKMSKDKLLELTAQNAFTSKMSMSALNANAYFGNFPSVGGGGIVIAYRTQSNGSGIVLVCRRYGGTAVVTNVSGGVACPLKFYFDGSNVAIQNGSNAIDVNLVVGTSNFVLSGSLPAGWDSGSAQLIDVTNVATEAMAENIAKAQKYSAGLANNAYLGYFPDVNGGSVVVAYRIHGNGTGLLLISKAYGGNVKVTNVSNNLTCPFTFYYDGVRVAVKNTYGVAIDYNVLHRSSNFVIANSLPTGWDAGSATAVPVDNIAQVKPVDLTNYATKSYADSAVISGKQTIGLSGNAYYGNFPDQGGGAIIIEWRKHNDGNGLLFINKPWESPIKALNVSNKLSCPLKIYSDGTRLVVQNSGSAIDVNLVATCSNFVLSNSLPTGWNSGNVSEITPTNLYPVDPMDIDTDPTIDLSLVNACARYRRDDYNKSDFSAVIVTDTHGDDAAVSRAVKYGAASPATSAIVHCGDFITEILAVGTTTTDWAPIVAASTKATYFVQGNHEKGTHWSLKYMPSDETLYNLFVKPIVDKGYLVNGEYEVNKCYYYHDFSATKTRLIVLDEYRAPMDYSEVYWKAIPYDSSLPDITDNTDYQTGDKGNVTGFTANSFEAVQDLNSGSYYQGRQPIYKVLRGCRYIDQTEAQWFLDTLYATPSDYDVVVALHNPFSDLASPVRSSKFTQKDIPVDLDGADWSQNYMATDFIADALNAFKNAEDFTETVSTKQNTEASYIPDYTVSKDFSQRSAGSVLVLFGGHVHRDVVWQHPTYTELFQVTPITGCTTSYGNYYPADICLQPDSSFAKYIDSLTSVSAKSHRIALCKIGCKATVDGTLRDIEVFDPAE